ncbi:MULTISPECIES: HlyD family secretion protein [Roseobacter]|uniref:HlyD family secretion-like protein n=1 Tax=Roseobacter litoralis (strain ATCC 49566 / DSM 6996 / JCM 21268 / NBRC 15278 / OCh 149) TaxID=391595 RepID=F7ZED6_ROSLO|nr:MULTISPECIES: biotin/lipoyl-binding protein [Roseobacter]AEI94649.1 HlyD family secretion-like protein [Roseobacter litoralis Och 149]GIT87968.1 hemolysin D [Roseobacter sp. OBYS 0001]
MLETLICALFTILPDYLYRRFRQGKRIGIEINLFSVWYELRWGITGCAIMALTVITTLFYFHPATNSVVSYFRTVTILPQAGGRVLEIYVKNNELVNLGQPIFRLEDHSQRAQVEAAKAMIAEADASLKVAQTDLTEAIASIAGATAALRQAEEELERNVTLRDQGSTAVRLAEIDRFENLVAQRSAQRDAAIAQQAETQERIDSLIPAQKDNALAQFDAANAELEKTVVYAGVTGRVEQLSLQVGDYISPVLRPAGVLVPVTSGRSRFQAGFNQMAAQVIKPGMIGEIGCMTKPFTVIPMVVVAVQDVIPSGQVRPSDRLLDPQNNQQPGSIMVYLEPLYDGTAEALPPGSNCIANVYTDNHERLEDESLSTPHKIALHVIDTIGVVHAAGLRLRLLLMPVQTLVFSGGH